MSYLDILLEGVEVRWKTLGDTCEIKTGKGITKKDSSDSALYPIISGGKTPMGNYDKFNRLENTITISRVGANAGHVSFIECKFYLNDKCFSILPIEKYKSKIYSKFLFYVLKTKETSITELQSEGGVPTINTTKVGGITIPIPPLSVQKEIVRILDTFTELTAELTARKKQYEFYREQFFVFDNKNVDWFSLGEIADVTKLAGYEFTEHIKYSDVGNIIAIRGLNVKKGFLNLTSIKYIDESNFSKLNRSKLIINDMLFTYVGTIGEVALIDCDNKYYLAPNVARIRILDERILPLFLRFYFQSYNFLEKQINRYLSSSSMKNLTMENIRKFKIPIPPLEEQKRIVSILDKFDTLTTSISEGLPKEIELRKKQYEYYRDMLLTFPKKETA